VADSIIKDIFLAGLGVASITKEKAEKLMDELAKRGEVTKDEAKEYIDKLLEKGKKEREDFRASVNKEVQRVIERLGLATKSDIAEVIRKIEELEKKVAGK
jgi:polyhydroxyalkanoate synthesis regulator phasin